MGCISQAAHFLKFNGNIFRGAGVSVVDKLPGAPGGAAALDQRPTFGECAKLFVGKGKLSVLRQLANDGEVFRLSRGGEADGQAESVRKGKLFFHGVARMDAVFAVGEILFEDVPAVGGGDDHHVGALFAEASFQAGFERGDFLVPLFQGEVVDEEDKLERKFRKHFFHVADLFEPVLGDFHGAQAFFRVLVEDGVNGGGFARSLVAVEEHIRVGQTAQETEGVVHDRLFFRLVIFEVGQGDRRSVVNGFELTVFKGERLVADEDPVAVVLVEFAEFVQRFVRIPLFSEDPVLSAGNGGEAVRNGGGDFLRRIFRAERQALQDAQIVRIGGADVLREGVCKAPARKQVVAVQDLIRQVRGERMLSL